MVAPLPPPPGLPFPPHQPPPPASEKTIEKVIGKEKSPAFRMLSRTHQKKLGSLLALKFMLPTFSRCHGGCITRATQDCKLRLVEAEEEWKQSSRGRWAFSAVSPEVILPTAPLCPETWTLPPVPVSSLSSPWRGKSMGQKG